MCLLVKWNLSSKTQRSSTISVRTPTGWFPSFDFTNLQMLFVGLSGPSVSSEVLRKDVNVLKIRFLKMSYFRPCFGEVH